MSSKIPFALAACLMTASAFAQDQRDEIERGGAGVDRGPEVTTDANAEAGANVDVNAEIDADADDVADAERQVDEAVDVVGRMKSDPELAEMLGQAHGVYIVTDYGQGAVIVGGEGGEGVVLLRQDGAPGGEWTDPAFFDFGGISIGAEVGGEAGPIAMLLMTEEAADMFRTEESNFSLDASTGLTILDYSTRADASAGDGDIVVWSGTQGAFAGAAIGFSGISRDEGDMEAYYGTDVDTREILSGNTSSDRGQRLREALAG